MLDTFSDVSPRHLSAAIFPSVKPYELATGGARAVQRGAQPASKTLTARSEPYNGTAAHAPWLTNGVPSVDQRYAIGNSAEICWQFRRIFLRDPAHNNLSPA
ncbi:MAG TPA: hypothetical protein VNL17_06680 [Verrucomicrobiae bacterium]|nr:hypothetical protein [Verrucomicrobiae bacterium]